MDRACTIATYVSRRALDAEERERARDARSCLVVDHLRGSFGRIRVRIIRALMQIIRPSPPPPPRCSCCVVVVVVVVIVIVVASSCL